MRVQVSPTWSGSAARRGVRGPGSRGRFARECNCARHLTGKGVHQPARILVRIGPDVRKFGRRDLAPLVTRRDPDVREHDPAALVHRGIKSVRRLQCSEGHGQVVRVKRIEQGTGIRLDAARQVASDGNHGFVDQFGKQQADFVV